MNGWIFDANCHGLHAEPCFFRHRLSAKLFAFVLRSNVSNSAAVCNFSWRNSIMICELLGIEKGLHKCAVLQKRSIRRMEKPPLNWNYCFASSLFSIDFFALCVVPSGLSAWFFSPLFVVFFFCGVFFVCVRMMTMYRPSFAFNKTKKKEH